MVFLIFRKPVSPREALKTDLSRDYPILGFKYRSSLAGDFEIGKSVMTVFGCYSFKDSKFWAGKNRPDASSMNHLGSSLSG